MEGPCHASNSIKSPYVFQSDNGAYKLAMIAIYTGESWNLIFDGDFLLYNMFW